MTSCGHAFCYQCIDETLLFYNTCPNCRENIKSIELVKCSLLDNMIKIVALMDSGKDGHPSYAERMEKF